MNTFEDNGIAVCEIRLCVKVEGFLVIRPGVVFRLVVLRHVYFVQLSEVICIDGRLAIDEGYDIYSYDKQSGYYKMSLKVLD